MTTPKSEFERELRAELERADFGHLSCEQAFEDGARWALDRIQTKVDQLAARVQKLEAALEKCHADLIMKTNDADHMYCTCTICEKARSKCEYCQALGGEE